MSTSMRVAGAALASVCAFASGAASAIELESADWKFTVNGNVNVHYIYSDCQSADTAEAIVTVGGACVQGSGEDSTSSVSNGLLPAALVFGASTTQDGYDIGVTFGLYPGISTNDGGSPNLQSGASNTALGTTGLDVRQVFATIGNAKMGTFTLGRNFGLFGFDAIINDMTLPGVGVGGAMSTGAPANTSLGSIGFGYIYTDTLAQMNYTTPAMGGLALTVGIFDPVEPILASAPTSKAAPGVHGKLSYTHAFGDSSKLFLWTAALSQQQEDVNGVDNDYSSSAIDFGVKLNLAALELMGYYYTGSGVGTTGLFVLSDDGAGNARDSDGYLAQASYTIGKTKLGVNYGVSNLDFANDSDAAATPNLLAENSKVTVGVYHSLTKNVTLLAEGSSVKTEAHSGVDNESNNYNVGAFVSF